MSLAAGAVHSRVSTTTQLTENQVQEVKTPGFDVQPGRVIEETVSGSVAAKERAGFQKLIEHMESGDV